MVISPFREGSLLEEGCSRRDERLSGRVELNVDLRVNSSIFSAKMNPGTCVGEEI